MKLLGVHTRGFVALVLSLFLSTSVGAEGVSDGEVRGTIVDDHEDPVSHALVTISSPQLFQARSTLSDERGRYRFQSLPPGRYSVEITHIRFRTLIEERLPIVLGEIMLRRHALNPRHGVVDVPERVQSPSHVVFPLRLSAGRTVTPELTDRIVTPRSYFGVAQLTPGVVAADGTAREASIHGGTSYSNAYSLDGVPISDPSSNRVGTLVNFDAIESVAVRTSLLSARTRATGGTVDVASRRGANLFDLDASVYWRPGQLQLLEPSEVDTSNDLAANLAVGGPIIRRKLWFYLSGTYQSETGDGLLTKSAFSDVEQHPSQIAFAAFLLGRLTFQPLPWQTFSLLLQGDPNWDTNVVQSSTTHPDAERQVYRGGTRAAFTSETRVGEIASWTNRVHYGSNREEQRPASGDLTLAGHRNIDSGTTTVNDFIVIDDNRYRLGFDSTVSTFVPSFLGEHTVAVGVDGDVSWATRSETRPGGSLFLDRDAPVNLDSPDDESGVVPYQELRVVEADERFLWTNRVGAFAEDLWRLFPNVALRGGVRFDSIRSYLDPKMGGDLLYAFNVPTPRFGVVWDPFSDGKTALRGGFAQYADVGLLAYSAVVGGGVVEDKYEYNPSTGRYDIFVERVQGRRVVAGEDLRPPLVNELSAGFSRQILSDAAISADVVFRRRDNMFEDVEKNVQWSNDGKTAVGFNDGTTEPVYVLETSTEAFQQYIGLDVTLEKSLSDGWSLLGTYTLSRLDGTVEDFVSSALDHSLRRPTEFGFLANDVRHNARVHLTYDFPLGATLGLTAAYISGRPYNALTSNSVLGGYVDREASRGFSDDGSELRLPDRFVVNTRLTWRLQELTGQDIWLIGDVRNILSQRTALRVEERVLASGSTSSFEDVLAREGPLRGTLALRVRF